MELSILKRLGLPPKLRDSITNLSCPDIFELADGRFAVIGSDLTEQLSPLLPADAACADYERIVVITRATLVSARLDIPDC